MKRTLLYSLMLCGPLAVSAPAFADDIATTSKIDQVKVFPRGAEVVRSASAKVPQGDHRVILEGLPGNLLPGSVRVKGMSDADMTIGSVDVRQVHVTATASPAERKKIEDEIERLNDEIGALQQQITDAQRQRKLLAQLGQGAITSRKGENGQLLISAEQLDALLARTSNGFSRLSTAIHKAQIEQRKRSKQIADLQKKLVEQAPAQKRQTVVAINLHANKSGSGHFSISYNINDAGWVPLYEARLKLGGKGKSNKLKLSRRAQVFQNSSERWENVSLTLSTARPNARTTPPALSPYILRFQPKFRPDVQYSKKLSVRRKTIPAERMDSPQSEAALAPPAPKAVQLQRPRLRFAGFLAEYEIQGKVSISNKNVQKTVSIGAADFTPDVTAVTVPRYDQKAYLAANFKLKSKTPYLPGPVMVFRDGVFLGKGRLPLLNPGQSHRLSFGADDFIKVSRRKVARKAGETGVFAKSRTDVRKFVTRVKNLHDFPMAITVKDFLPYSTHEDIVVKMLDGATSPTRKDVKNRRGIMAWDLKLNPAQEATITYGYQVSWPKGKRITPVR